MIKRGAFELFEVGRTTLHNMAGDRSEFSLFGEVPVSTKCSVCVTGGGSLCSVGVACSWHLVFTTGGFTGAQIADTYPPPLFVQPLEHQKFTFHALATL